MWYYRYRMNKVSYTPNPSKWPVSSVHWQRVSQRDDLSQGGILVRCYIKGKMVTACKTNKGHYTIIKNM